MTAGLSVLSNTLLYLTSPALVAGTITFTLSSVWREPTNKARAIAVYNQIAMAGKTYKIDTNYKWNDLTNQANTFVTITSSDATDVLAIDFMYFMVSPINENEDIMKIV